MTQLPLVSVIIPVYNRAALVEQTIASLVNQSYKAWEAIVVDDGSTDGSQAVIEKYAKEDARINLLCRQRKPKGASTCRNIAIENSQGDYVIFLDSDDLLAIQCLQNRISDFKEHPNYDFLVYGMQFFTHRPGDHTRIWLEHFQDGYLSGFLLQSQWAITGPIWKRESLLRLGGFDEHLLSWEDGDLHRRALIKGLTFKVFNVVDAYCRRDAARVRIGSKDHEIKYLLSRQYQLDKIWKMLVQKQLVTSVRSNIMAGQYVTLCRMLTEQKQSEIARKIWQTVYQKRIVSFSVFQLVKVYLTLRSQLANPFGLRIVKKLFGILLPKYVIWYG